MERIPQRRVVLAEQFRLLLRRQRGSFGILLVGLALLAFAYSRTWIYPGWPAAGVTFGWILSLLLLLLTVWWALAIWRDEPPRDRRYFWLQPTSRGFHTAARCAAGAALLCAAIAVAGAVLAGAVLTLPGGEALAARGAPPGAAYWLLWPVSALLAFALASIAAVASNRPSAWLVGGAVGAVTFHAIAELRGIRWLDTLLSPLFDAPFSLTTALSAPNRFLLRSIAAGTPEPDARLIDSMPVVALLLWLTVAAAGLVLAIRFTRPR
ncbi:MAG TPA: hypothetical protein VF188_13760 [Longimicrobiales bacterium]